MALKYFVVRRGAGSRTVFIVPAAQELRFRTSIKDIRPAVAITAFRTLQPSELVAALCGILVPGVSLAFAPEVVALGLPEVATLACEAHLRGVRMRSYREALAELRSSVESGAAELTRAFMQNAVHQGLALRAYVAAKNALEPVIAVLALVVLSPVLAAVALAVKLTSPGPVLYRQTRVGHRGKNFEILKFRSMRIDAEKDGPVWNAAGGGDSRLSPIGAFLRATHLDELPQFWNVAKGELSFIGPRPERPVFVDRLVQEIPLFALRTMVKPGISGWAQVRQGYANSVDDSRAKLELDFHYILKHSPWLDLQIVLRTLGIVTAGGTEGKKRGGADARRPARPTVSIRFRRLLPAGHKRLARAPAVSAPRRPAEKPVRAEV